ncbi:MAG: DASS family sodium-coupled anion symporter [Candidatus Marinimicrobia bacterium]|nr:DASS family sodium-coupled anion symporter [Candidatus Neomarinimicrobiota bacterium]
MIKSVLYWSYQKRWLLFAFLLGALLFYLPYPGGLTPEGYRTLIITVMVVILIISEAVPLPATGLLIAVLQVVFGLGSASTVAQSYASDAVFFIMGSLMLAVAIVRQGLDARLTLGILWLTGNRVTSIMWGFFVISLLLTSFMGEHTIVAMLLPVALTLVRNTGRDDQDVRGLMSLLLFALAYGSIIGSFGTPSGGARNAIMIEYLADSGVARMSYLRWIIFAYPVLLIQIPLGGWLLTRTFKPEMVYLDRAVRKLKAQVGRTGPLTPQQILAVALFVLIFLGWIFLSDTIGIGIVALAGVFLYLATGLVQWSDLNQRTNWGVVLLYAGVISLGLQLRDTGAAMWLAQNLVQVAGGLMERFEVVRYMLVIGMSTLVVNIMSPSATVAVLGPMFINFGGHPVLLGMTTAIASAFGYMTAVGSAAGMIIASTGLLKPNDFVRAGWRFTLMSIACLLLAIMFYWPWLVKE